MVLLGLVVVAAGVALILQCLRPSRVSNAARVRCKSTGPRPVGSGSFGEMTHQAEKAVSENLFSEGGSLCESVIPALRKVPYTASLSNNPFCTGTDSDSEWSVATDCGLETPSAFRALGSDSSLNLAEQLLRAVVPVDVEAVLNLVWQPPVGSVWSGEIPRSSSCISKPVEDVEHELLTSCTLERCRDSAKEITRPARCQSALGLKVMAEACQLPEGAGQELRVSSSEAGYGLWATPKAIHAQSCSALPQRMAQDEDVEEVDEDEYAERVRTLSLQARMHGTSRGVVHNLERDVLLMNPAMVMDSLVAIILGEASSTWHRTAAADVLCWFSLHPKLALRSDVRKRVVEAAISACLDDNEDIKHTGFRAIRNLLEDTTDMYQQALLDDMYLPSGLVQSLNVESCIYLNEILTLMEDKTDSSLVSLVGANCVTGATHILSFVNNLLSDDRGSTLTAREHLLPCALSSLARLINADVVEEFCAGSASRLHWTMNAVGECVSIQTQHSHQTAVSLMEIIASSADASPLRDTIYKTLVTCGGVGSLFEVLGAGTESFQLASLNILHKIQAWDSFLLASLLGPDERMQLEVVLDKGLGPQKKSVITLIQKQWFQNSLKPGSGIQERVIKLIDYDDPKVQNASICALATMVIAESPKKEVSMMVAKNMEHVQQFLLSTSGEGAHCRIMIDLLIRFLGSENRLIQLSTLRMLMGVIGMLDMDSKVTRRLLACVCKIFPSLFQKEDADMALMVFETLSEAGSRRPDLVAEIVLGTVDQVDHVWNLHDHMHQMLPIQVLHGFGRVLWQLRSLELQKKSR